MHAHRIHTCTIFDSCRVCTFSSPTRNELDSQISWSRESVVDLRPQTWRWLKKNPKGISIDLAWCQRKRRPVWILFPSTGQTRCQGQSSTGGISVTLCREMICHVDSNSVRLLSESRTCTRGCEMWEIWFRAWPCSSKILVGRVHGCRGCTCRPILPFEFPLPCRLKTQNENGWSGAWQLLGVLLRSNCKQAQRWMRIEKCPVNFTSCTFVSSCETDCGRKLPTDLQSNSCAYFAISSSGKAFLCPKLVVEATHHTIQSLGIIPQTVTINNWPKADKIWQVFCILINFDSCNSKQPKMWVRVPRQ